LKGRKPASNAAVWAASEWSTFSTAGAGSPSKIYYVTKKNENPWKDEIYAKIE
jgi:hypothetical protein